jgi:hypothetical protein
MKTVFINDDKEIIEQNMELIDFVFPDLKSFAEILTD